jgi:hypothetical protein
VSIFRRTPPQAAADPVPARSLIPGTEVTAFTEDGREVAGRVRRVWRTHGDESTGQFRILCDPLPRREDTP